MKFIVFVLAVLVISQFAIKCVQADGLNWDRLITALIEVESGGDPNAVSKAGAVGLMQITPIVLSEYSQFLSKNGVTEIYAPDGSLFSVPLYMPNLYNSSLNKIIGTWYLKRLKDHYLKDSYTLERLLCAWNGGITRLRKHGYDCSKMPRESINFSRKVMRLYKAQRMEI